MKRHFLLTVVFLGGISSFAIWMVAQDAKPDSTVIRVTVDLVQLEVAVTDKKGDYVTGLSPWDFAVYEDQIPQKIASFGEAQTPRMLADFTQGESKPQLAEPTRAPRRHAPQLEAPPDPAGLASAIAGASVFILFDTSNYMYRGFAFAQDAIAEFVRTLDHPARVAFYSYSRDFSRPALLTADRSVVLHGVRATVAGDDAALYDALLMTLKDAAQFSDRKVVVVFSNGPDNASMAPPEDVRELAQSEGIPIYMISTRDAKLEPVSAAVFERMSTSTGGKAYFAKNWEEQQKAFASIRDDLAHLYALSYYPQTNSNRGWRRITVKLVGDPLKNYHIRTRSGYRPKGSGSQGPMTATPGE